VETHQKWWVSLSLYPPYSEIIKKLSCTEVELQKTIKAVELQKTIKAVELQKTIVIIRFMEVGIFFACLAR
jgi:hypothetical protein